MLPMTRSARPSTPTLVSSTIIAALIAVSLGCSGPEMPADVSTRVESLERTAVVDRSDSVLHYYESGEHSASLDVVLGAPESPTPIGAARIWKSESMDPEGAYGSWRLSIEFENDSGGWDRAAYAVHGTNHPELLEEPAPRFFSNGCIRLENDEILWLADRLEEGDSVFVVP